MKPFKSPVRSMLALSLALAAMPVLAQDDPYSKTVFFGDSLALGVQYHPAEQTFVEHFRQIIDDGLLKRRRKHA